MNKIVKILSNTYTVDTGVELINCIPRGVFRKNKITPLVGDYVEIDNTKKVITKILPRINYLTRPPIANIDAALVVTSVKLPNLSLNLLDKMISVLEINKISPILIFSKLDLLEDLTYINNIINYYKKLNYIVLINTEIDKIKEILKGKTVVITGQTGAGKSTLLNHLNEDLKLETSEISYALGRGVHTTRHTEIYPFSNFYIADTPGFSALSLEEYTNEQIRDSFKEFNDSNCKYRDCMHYKETPCNIKDKVLNKEILESRYNNYIEFIKGEKK